MSQFKTLLFLLCAFIAIKTNAQIAKGNYSLDGAAGIYTQIQKNDFSKTTTSNLLLNPSFGKFVTDKWLVGVAPTAYFVSENTDFTGLFSTRNSTSKGTAQLAGLTVNTRYYFFGDAKVACFGTLGAGFSKRWNSYESSSTPKYSYSSNSRGFNAGFGASIFVHPEVAFEPILSYANSTESYDNSGVFGTNAATSVQSVSLTLKFSNFVNFSAKKDDKEQPQYVKSGRQIVGGQANITKSKYSFTSDWGTTYVVNPMFGQFVTNNFFLGAEMNLFGFTGINDYFLNASVSGRYYIKLSPKFYLYPDVNVAYTKSLDLTSSSTQKPKGVFNYGGGLGGSFFITNNVAIDARFLLLQSAKDEVGNGFNAIFGAENIRLLYFLR
jgi:hypothetical protein